MQSVARCVEKFFPQMTGQEIPSFLYVFFPFLFGIYPYTFVTDKQKTAMEQANVNYVSLSLYEITYACVKKLLEGYK